MLVIGGLGIVVGIGNIFFTVVALAAVQQNDPSFIGGRLIGAVVSLIWGIVVTLGGSKLKSLQSYGSAMTGVIFAMLPCNPVCVLGLFIGIWALVMMNQQEVKDAFR